MEMIRDKRDRQALAANQCFVSDPNADFRSAWDLIMLVFLLCVPPTVPPIKRRRFAQKDGQRGAAVRRT